jgi:ATP-dependent Clp protease ATP-binding subunit ClpC
MNLGDLFSSRSDHGSASSPVPPGQDAKPLSDDAPTTTIDPILKQDLNALSHLDSRAQEILNTALNEAKRLKKSFIEPEQLLFGLLSDREILKIMQDFSLDVAALARELQANGEVGTFAGDPTLSEASKQILEDAYAGSKKREADFITPEDILLAIFDKSVAVSDSLKAKGVEKEKVKEKISKSPAALAGGKKSALASFGVDMTQLAKDGKLDPVTGRDREVERMVHILLRRTKNNPIIIGEAGVGKTAIVEGLCQLIVTGKVSPDLASKKVIRLDVSSLVAGASHRGEFEDRLQQVIKETMAASGMVILFIDEIHTLIGAGETSGALDASNIIKPYLSRGQLQIIGTTTTAEFRRYFEKDRAFERRFQPIICEEPSEENALLMLQVLQPKYEAYHKVTFTPEALKQAVKLSKRYVGERYLPDKAIDLLDEAGAQVRLDQTSGKRADTSVKEQDIENVVSSWTGIPISKLTEKESDKLLNLEKLIHEKFVNHERAVKAVSEAVRRGRIGLANVNRPIASFIFLGPTGVGKTELAKRLAEIMFGKADAMIRLDMSEYMEKHEVAKLLGAPPGYVGYEEGGQLTEAVRTKPYSIVLLDEVEKAHPDVFNILLQLLEDGRLTDNKGNTVSFKNTVVICTSNIGSQLIQQKLQAAKEAQGQKLANGALPTPPANPAAANGVSPAVGIASSSSVSGGNSVAAPVGTGDVATAYKELSKILMDQLLKFFRPELVNRFDEVVIFEPLTAENMLYIAKLGIEGTSKLLKDQNIGLTISQNALAQLAKEGFDPVYGARPLRRLIQREVENPIAIYLIQKSIVPGDTVGIDYNPTTDKFVFNKVQAAPTVATPSVAPPLNAQSPVAAVVPPSTPPNPPPSNQIPNTSQ